MRGRRRGRNCPQLGIVLVPNTSEPGGAIKQELWLAYPYELKASRLFKRMYWQKSGQPFAIETPLDVIEPSFCIQVKRERGVTAQQVRRVLDEQYGLWNPFGGVFGYPSDSPEQTPRYPAVKRMSRSKRKAAVRKRP